MACDVDRYSVSVSTVSEWMAVVYCTCFQDGLTREPPLDRTQLTVNRFGVVTVVGSEDHSEDPERLWHWRVGMALFDESDIDDAPPACEHHDMHVMDEIFYWPGARAHAMRVPIVEAAAAAGDFPLLTELLYRPEAHDYPSGGAWCWPREAQPLMNELTRLRDELPDTTPPGEQAFVEQLDQLLQASSETGNPIILHYNGIGDDAW